MNACRSGLLSIVHLLAKSDVSLNQKTRVRLKTLSVLN